MDTKALDKDINSIIEAFTESGGLELSQMKELWRARGFSYIHEGRLSSVKPAVFMQAMYSSALERMREDMPWSTRLGGLYVLYILHETQLFSPPFRIYLSLDDLEGLLALVTEAKAKGPLVVLKIVRRMMMNDFFLYGSVTTSQKKMKEAVNDFSVKADTRMESACQNFLQRPLAQKHLEGDLVKDLKFDELELLNMEYNMVKQRIYSGNDGGTSECRDVFADELKRDVHAWMEQRKAFKKTEEMKQNEGIDGGQPNLSLTLGELNSTQQME